MKKVDIVLIPFPFTNLKGNKKRPAIVLHIGKLDIIVSFLTTKLKWQESTDILLKPDNKNNLKKTSLIRTNKLATLDIDLLIGKIGSLNEEIITELDFQLKKIFQLI